MKNLFLTFNHDVAVENNKNHFGWQNPVLFIEKGFTHVLTGSFVDLVDIQIGDIIYIYGGLKNNNVGTNGIYGVGDVVDILTGEAGGNKYAVVDLKKHGGENKPLLKTDVDKDFFTRLCSTARLRVGYHILSDDDTARLDAMIG